MENTFYVILKGLFVLEIFIFLSCLFGYVEKRFNEKVKANFKIYEVTDWTKNNYDTYASRLYKKWRQSGNEIWSLDRISHSTFIQFWMFSKVWSNFYRRKTDFVSHKSYMLLMYSWKAKKWSLWYLILITFHLSKLRIVWISLFNIISFWYTFSNFFHSNMKYLK